MWIDRYIDREKGRHKRCRKREIVRERENERHRRLRKKEIYKQTEV